MVNPSTHGNRWSWVGWGGDWGGSGSTTTGGGATGGGSGNDAASTNGGSGGAGGTPAVPEPATVVLMGTGLAYIAYRRRINRQEKENDQSVDKEA